MIVFDVFQTGVTKVVQLSLSTLWLVWMCGSWVYLALQNIPSATVLTLSNKVVLLYNVKELSLSGNLENYHQATEVEGFRSSRAPISKHFKEVPGTPCWLCAKRCSCKGLCTSGENKRMLKRKKNFEIIYRN